MVRFLADASLHHAIVTGCLRRESTIDFVSARTAKLEGMSDLDVLALAAAQDRILVTHDFRTMPRHFAEFLATGATSPGVFLVKQQTPLAPVIDDLLLIWTASMPEDWKDRIVAIPLH
jgi:predicted nuclease of predicted toxin-antitoxin system